jgi:hypothetical protein
MVTSEFHTNPPLPTLIKGWVPILRNKTPVQILSSAYNKVLFKILLLLYLSCKWDFTRGSDTTIRHNTQITHITQNNTPHSNKTHHTKLRNQYRTHYTKWIQHKIYNLGILKVATFFCSAFKCSVSHYIYTYTYIFASLAFSLQASKSSYNKTHISSSLSLIWKSKSRLMRFPCCLYVCGSPLIYFWMSEPAFMKLGIYIMSPEPISFAYSINPSHQFVCNPHIIARQRLGKVHPSFYY